MKKIFIALGLTVGIAPAVWADNVAHCEVVIMQVVNDETTAGEAQVATFAPAVTFLSSLYDDEDGHITTINNQPIRAVLCRRNDVIPSESDYNIIATGIPFSLSQNFDSAETDSLTVYWKDGAFKSIHKGHPLSDEGQDILDTRLADFTQRGLKLAEKDEDEEAEKTAEEFPEKLAVDIAENDAEGAQTEVTDIAVPAEIEDKIEFASKTENELFPVPDAINEAIIEAIGDADISQVNKLDTDN